MLLTEVIFGSGDPNTTPKWQTLAIYTCFANNTYIHSHISCVVLKARLHFEINRLPCKEILDVLKDLHCLDVCVRDACVRL